MILSPSPAQKGSSRLRRGTKSSAVSSITTSDLPSLGAIDGPFQLAEFLALKVRADPHDVASLVEVPAEGRSTDRDVWVYEHLRRLPIDLTPLVSQLLTHCTKESCAEMKADQWQYLCVAHGSGVSEECCAIDYILHTLDSATAILNSTKNFPSRMSIPPGSLSHFPSLSRRLSRIFSHAYFHHREVFLLSESETSLYARFVALCEAYSLVGKDLLIIPHPSKVEDSVEEEDNGSEEENGEADDDDEAEEEDRTREKEIGAGKRTLSLDRQSGVGFKMLSREKGKGKVTGAEADIESGTVQEAAMEEAGVIDEKTNTPDTSTDSEATQAEPVSESQSHTPANNIGAVGRQTKGRGKQSRGTMLWSSDTADVPSIPEVPVLEGSHDLTRTESRETVIFLGDEDSVAGQDLDSHPTIDLTRRADPSGGGEEEEVPVPKDEIELLEEAGVLDSAPTVSPLPSVPISTEKTAIDESNKVPAVTESETPALAENSSAKAIPRDSEKTAAPTDSILPQNLSPTRQPKTSTSPQTFSPTAAASPLNPPRSLSRSPEARHKALAAANLSSPSPNQKKGGKGSGLAKIDNKKEGTDELDAEGSKAIVPDVPDRIGSPVDVKKGEGKDTGA